MARCKYIVLEKLQQKRLERMCEKYKLTEHEIVGMLIDYASFNEYEKIGQYLGRRLTVVENGADSDYGSI